MRWDIFCKVIDNHGDLGVTWRLSAELAARGEEVRLWVDEPASLAWMAPGGRDGVDVVRWDANARDAEPGDVVVEAFGCDPHEAFVAAMARRWRSQGRQPAWINLEYLSAETWVERFHGLPSPVAHGPGAGLVKRFIYPGFTPRTGGLIREHELAQRQQRFDRAAWLREIAPRLQDEAGAPIPAETLAAESLVSLFCYEPPALSALLRQLGESRLPKRLLVTSGRAGDAVRRALATLPRPHPRLAFLPLLSQAGYDELLWASDLNFVRGEDSLVRAIWAGRPFVWQIYPQQDQAHEAKLRAFLDLLAPPASLRQAFLAWNGLSADWPGDTGDWIAAAEAFRARLQAQPELVTTLMTVERDEAVPGGGGLEHFSGGRRRRR
ncbi:elongation factor P maturation arginine rhamnosyltransferase EarP [Ramlibacter rhizophilus]|uniref:Protein-arginine rhamnosyltransferase n=2 Tax=Ramlibacter rhizophilus TaxID=1781167 RepID=A0A4Z0BHM2_9BURK|nr:elongation factor P maturation arginine rhamnosyltransferase EarP [Ramlibacter rhizophilus]